MRALWLVAAVLAIAACNDPLVAVRREQRLCTLVGCLSVATLTLAGALADAPISGEACFGDYCRHFVTELSPGGGSPSCRFDPRGDWDYCAFDDGGALILQLEEDGSLHHPDPSQIALTVRDGSGRLLLESTVSAPLSERHYPNGEACDLPAGYWCQGASAAFALPGQGP
jgi:hypothetical protein